MPISTEIVMKASSQDERNELQAKLDRCRANDIWAEKAFKNVALLIITYPGQRAYLKQCVESHHKLGYFMALSYDNYVDPADDSVDHNDCMPDKETLDKIDLLMMPHHQTWKDTDYPFFWALKWGAAALQQFEYVYCLNGDFIMEKPENFGDLLALMGDADIMTCGPDYENFLANGAFIIKSSYFSKMVKFMQDTYIPFENYEKHVHKYHNAEERMAHAVPYLGMKKFSVAKPLIWDRKNHPKGTWFDVVGLRHIHGELDYAIKKRLPPPPYQYLDERHLLPIYNYQLIRRYWDTQDASVLEDWRLK